MSTVASLLLLPNFLFSPPKPHGLFPLRPNSRVSVGFRFPSTLVSCSTGGGKKTAASRSDMDSPAVDCVGTGTDVECFVAESSSEADKLLPPPAKKSPAASFEIGGGNTGEGSDVGLVQKVFDWALLVSPFFFWGTAMVAMKEVIPKTGPFFVSAFRLIPAGALLIGFATVRGRKQPTGALAWLSIVLFGVVDAACFQGFLAEGLQSTSAGLGSVIIDSQPLTVAILAAVLFGESIGAIGAAGLVLGVIGLLLLEVPALSFEGHSSTIWGSGEWWMLLAAQSMAVGTVMVRWVSKYSDPVMATGWVDTLFQYFFLLITLSIKEWIHLLSPFLLEGVIMSCYLHMIIGGLPLLVISVLNHDPAMSGNIMGLTSNDLLALCYTSIFGSAISYGVYFYNATRGSLTKLSSLTFLTPMFASIFGFLYLGETFSPLQLAGALVTVIAIYMVNYRDTVDEA